MKHRRPLPEASIAFLDVVTCGFGAIILLLVITKVGFPEAPEPVPEPAPLRTEALDALTEQLFATLDEQAVVADAIKDARQRLASLQGELARLERRREARGEARAEAALSLSAQSRIEEQLEAALQSLTDEMRRLQARNRPREDNPIGGIPVDSEYIIFIIDTSGSMFRFAWQRMMDQLVETLDVYPRVEGIQVMNDMGTYMFPSYRGRFMPDNPGRRRAILARLRTWTAFSNSSPVEGITAAIRTYYRPDRKLSLYVFGDEFDGGSIRDVVDAVERINPKNAAGEPQVRIHAVGFPVQFANPPHLRTTGIRFASLMRELTRRNGGTFVALNDFR